MSEDAAARWLTALEARHLADLTPPEVARALRALSSCYVERRAKLSGALDSAGKRAAFGLFYAPLHFLVVQAIVRALGEKALQVTDVLDLGCGTGSAGAAWALETHARSIAGVDRHPWAVAEANWTYRELNLRGRATQGDVARTTVRPERGLGILAAYTINEVTDETREAILPRLLAASDKGSRVLIVEPIARTMTRWWPAWERAFIAAGGRMDEWRFPSSLPPRQRQLGRAAGLDPRELTARTLWL